MNDKTLIEFPARLAVKAMGLNVDDFEACIRDLVLPLIDVDNATVSTLSSKEGKYLSVSVHFVASDLAQLERIYAVLNDEPRVLYRL